jgi:integrase
MGVYKNKKDGKYWIDYWHLGKRYRKKVGASKRQAVAVFSKIKSQIAENRYLDVRKNKDVKLPELLNYFIEHYSKINNKPSSYRRNKQIAATLVKYFGGRFIYHIENVDVEGYKKSRKEQGVSFSTINREMALLKTVLNKAKEWEVLQTPVPKIKLFKVDNRRVRYLTEDEYRKLLDLSPEPLRSIILIAVNTGMRRGELLSLKWKDVDVKEQIVTLWDTKNREKRHIYMNSVVADAFIGVRGNDTSEYVFPGKEGNTHISESYVSHMFSRLVEQAGIKDFRYHDMRHTFGSWLAMEGFSLKTIQDLLGHKSIEMTLRYAHLSPEHKKMAVERLERRSKSPEQKREELTVSDAANRHLLDTKSEISQEAVSLSIKQ